MGVARLNIWISDLDNPYGTWSDDRSVHVHVFDCQGPVHWRCGRYRAADGNWKQVPDGVYRDLPSTCGHLEVEIPPGYYWVFATFPRGGVGRGDRYWQLNVTTHAGIVHAKCDEASCVKLFNPSVKLCWRWYRIGLHALQAARPEGWQAAHDGLVRQITEAGDRLVRELRFPVHPADAPMDALFEELRGSLGQGKSSA